MIKKIEDITVRDIKNTCKKHKRCSKKCPLEAHSWLCLGMYNMKEKELKEEVEL